MIRIPRFPLAVLFVALAAFSQTAHAQFSVYGEFTVDRLSNIVSSPVLNTLSPGPCAGTQASPSTSCTSYNNSVNPLGFTGGVSYDIKTFGPATLAIDLRGAESNAKHGAQTFSEGTGAHIYSVLGGAHVSFRTFKPYLNPYVQGSIGYARTNYGVLTNAGATASGNTVFPGIATQNALEYHGYAGLDLRFLPYAAWRVFEVGYGAVQANGNYSHNYPIYSISTGVVLHFPTR